MTPRQSTEPGTPVHYPACNDKCTHFLLSTERDSRLVGGRQAPPVPAVVLRDRGTKAGQRLIDKLTGSKWQDALAGYVEDIEAQARASLLAAVREETMTATRDVESRHRQGDYTEDGWVGNSIDGIECNGCGERWPCAAQRLRLALLDTLSDEQETGR